MVICIGAPQKLISFASLASGENSLIYCFKCSEHVVLQIVHAQKRIDLRKTLEACIGRILELKHVRPFANIICFIISNLKVWELNCVIILSLYIVGCYFSAVAIITFCNHSFTTLICLQELYTQLVVYTFLRILCFKEKDCASVWEERQKESKLN